MSVTEKTINVLNIINTLKYFDPVIKDDRPAFFTSAEEEYNALYYGAGLRVLPELSIIELAGSDVPDFLQRITTNNVSGIEKGKLTETVFVTEKGKVIDKTFLLNFGEKHSLLCSGICKHKLQLWIDKYTISEDVKILTDLSPKVVLELYGPQAESFLMWSCSDFNVPGNDSFAFTLIDNFSFTAAKTSLNGRSRILIIVDFVKVKDLLSHFLSNKGIYDFALVGEEAFSAFRIEQGLISAPGEINDKFTPAEIGLRKLICSSKGNFLGYEFIARAEVPDTTGNTLSGINFPSEFKYEGEMPLNIFRGDEQAGIASSIAYSPKYKRCIGLGIIKNPALGTGKYFVKDTAGSKFEITLIELPFRK
jgi:aminomethyltransferase